MRLAAGYVDRPTTWGDLDAVCDLLRACDLADAGVEDPVRDHLRDDWRFPTFELGRDSRVVVEGDEVVAYVSVAGLNPERSLEIFGGVHPSHRGRGLGTDLVSWGERRAAERSPALPVLRASAPAADAAGRRLFEARGFRYARTFLHLRRSLDAPVEEPPEVDGVSILRYDAARHVRGTYDALEEAFLDHWATEPYPYEAHERETAETDPSLIAVAESGDEVVGAAMSRLVEGQGWVDVIGTRRAWRGRGVARAMLLTVFASLRSAGATSVTLSVDSENETGATRLYDGVGMREHRRWTKFEKRFRGETPG